MINRLRNALVALAALVLAICAFALPASAWDWSTSYAGGFTLYPEDTSLFEGLELNARYIDEWFDDWEQEDAVFDKAGAASGLTGIRSLSSGYDLYLAPEGSEGEGRIDLSAPENAALANARVRMECYACNALDADIDHYAILRYDPETDTCAKATGYTVEERETTIDGQPTTAYYLIFSGRLADVLAYYVEFSSIDHDAPIPNYDAESGEYRNYWRVGVDVVGEHVEFQPVWEDEDSSLWNPATYSLIEGGTELRFDATRGFKFAAPTDEGYVASVSYTVNGVTTKLAPTDETYGNSSSRVYQLPPTEGPVTITISAHELQYTVNANGTISFEDDYYPVAYRVSFDMPEGVTFNGAVDMSYNDDFRTAFKVANLEATSTGGYDYYCWADKPSRFSFKVPSGYYLEGVTVSPEGAGRATVPYSPGLQVSLSAPATLTLAVAKLEYTHVDTDPATGISAALVPQDVQWYSWDLLTFYAAEQTDAGELAKASRAIASYATESGESFAADQLKAYDVWYKGSDGYQYMGGLVPILTLENGAKVTIPLPSGWDAKTTRVFQYFEEDLGEQSYTEVDKRSFEVSEDGKSLVVYLPFQLGRIVLASEASAAPHPAGWDKDASGAWVYYKADGTIMTDDWAPAGGTYYYMDATGHVFKGGLAYYKGNGKHYFVNDSGKVETNSGWKPCKGVYYYVKSDGSAVVSDWQKINGSYYYFGADGAAYVNAWLSYGGARYYFGADGKLYVSQWLKADGTYYYFGDNGAAYVEKWLNYGGSWYYFGADGKVYVNEWLKTSGTYYYFGADGAAYVNKWLNYGGSWYYFEGDGKIAVNKWVQVGDTWYHFNTVGACDNSWKG